MQDLIQHIIIFYHLYSEKKLVFAEKERKCDAVFFGYSIIIISMVISALLNKVVFHFVYKLVSRKQGCFNFKNKALFVSFIPELCVTVVTAVYCVIFIQHTFDHPVLAAYRLLFPNPYDNSSVLNLGITLVSSVAWIIIYPILMFSFGFMNKEKAVKSSTKIITVLITTVTNAPYHIIFSLSAIIPFCLFLLLEFIKTV